MTCLPSVMFDPVWLLFDKQKKSRYSNLNNFDNFFKKTNEKIDTFFENRLWGYHWHSRHRAKIERGSYFDKIENMINNKIDSRIEK